MKGQVQDQVKRKVMTWPVTWSLIVLYRLSLTSIKLHDNNSILRIK
jgi:hypothetical protein